MMTDPNPHQASLRGRSVFEFDMDLMITTTLRIDPRRLFLMGQTESRPDVSRLGFVTDRDKLIPTGRTESQPNISGWRSFTGSIRKDNPEQGDLVWDLELLMC